MAIEKDIAIHHSKGIDNTITYTTDREKSSFYRRITGEESGFTLDELIMRSEDSDILNALSYAENLEKTLFSLDGDKDILVTGVECSKDSASAEFAIIRKKYYEVASEHVNRITGTKTNKKTGEKVKKESIEAYHVIQSFPAVENLDPRLVHKIGIEYAKAAFPGHQCVVSTHMNTAHLHNHIIVNAYSKEHIGRKYRMNMERRREIRRINDKLSLKYDLPILMDNDPAHHNKGISWKEWKSRQDGNSWKEKLKNDIRSASSLTGSWEEYKALMKKNGYKIRETKNTVTYTMPDSDTRKCRDSRLGEKFTRDHLLNVWLEKAAQSEEKTVKAPQNIRYEPAPRPAGIYHIHVNRYTASGRRRTELEMLILTAIQIIRYFKDRFLDLFNDWYKKDPANYPYAKKIDCMYKALEMLKKCNVSTKAELKIRMNDVGAKLSHTRKEIRELEPILEYQSEIAEKIKAAQELEADLKERRIIPDQLFIHTFSDKEIAHNVARLQPMTPELRRMLYQRINRKGLFLKYKFEDISLSKAKAIIDYADGKTDVIPSGLITKDEAKEKAISKQLQETGLIPPDTIDTHIEQNKEADRSFDLLTARYSDADKKILFSLRDLLNELASYGIRPGETANNLKYYESIMQKSLTLKKKMIELKNEYKDLSRLKWYTDMAEDTRFLRGPLFSQDHPSDSIDSDPSQTPAPETSKDQEGTPFTENDFITRR